jgi:hypothetical protein
MLNILQQNNKSTTLTTRSEEEGLYTDAPFDDEADFTPSIDFFTNGQQLIILSSVNEDNDAEH